MIKSSVVTDFPGNRFPESEVMVFEHTKRPEPPPVFVCCLYPWPNTWADGLFGGTPGTPFYPFADLPTPIFYDGVQFDLTGANYGPFELFYYPVSDYPSAGFRAEIAPGGGFYPSDWILWHPILGVIDRLNCLVGTWLHHDVVDNFSNSLTINPGATTITRSVEVCTWTGSGRTLRYNSTTYKFELDGLAKTGNQNTPVGTYGAETIS